MQTWAGNFVKRVSPGSGVETLEMMDQGKLPDRKTGSVKAAVSSYGERIGEGNPTIKKFRTNYPEVSTKLFAASFNVHFVGLYALYILS